ncbi:GlsB/YeaQ/YmgE family stress response membrane protein [Algimonas porphyrae]|uniref:GlsB/YeaQ/YmgE family stress response membrane protein n=1 Tax=Algimonas porphyrae TaxID=1128113 RepID=A0ABQ5V0K8_9PROT|nr:GlsB/YeaQ/YmgE family stress response membrane protein [Algimonas porphyrae]GLQ20709.1 hypothetical protein GCM10007854_16640 [Algimonas porphyrae]
MTLEAILIWILIGAVAGWLAGVVMKSGRPYGLIGDIIIGIVGAFIGGWLLGMLGVAFGGILGTIVTAFIGAVVLIFLIRLIKKA